MNMHTKPGRSQPRIGAPRLTTLCALLAAMPLVASADTAPVGVNGALVNLPGQNYTVRLSDDFSTTLNLTTPTLTGKWRPRKSSAAAVEAARCSAEASIDDETKVWADTQYHSLVVRATTTATSPTGGAVTYGGVHREHRAGGIISEDALGYGFYEVRMKPYDASKGVHSAFWNMADSSAGRTSGQTVIEIDSIEVDSADGTARTATNPNPSAFHKGTKNLMVWLADEPLDLQPYERGPQPNLPWPARGNREYRVGDTAGFIKTGFDYGPDGVKYFENGVQVSHTDFPEAYQKMNARHEIWLTAKAGINIGSGDPALSGTVTGISETRFKDFKFYAADYFDVNLLPNGDFEFSNAYNRIGSTNQLAYDKNLDGTVIYNSTSNSCNRSNPYPTGVQPVGTLYPIQWTLTGSNVQTKTVAEPTPGNDQNHVMKVAGVTNADLNAVLSQTHKHINGGEYMFRGRVKRPAGYLEARVRITYTNAATGSTGETYIPLPNYSTATGTTPTWAEIAPTAVNVVDAGEDTFLKIEIIGRANTADPSAPSGTIAKNYAAQDLVMYLDDLQLYKRSSPTAAAPARTSSGPGYNYGDKSIFRNYADEPHYFGPISGTVDDTGIYHLVDRSAGFNTDDFTVSVDVYPAVLKDTLFIAKMDGNSNDAKKGWALGMKADGTPYCAVGNLSSSTAHQLLRLTPKFTPYASAGPKSGYKLTCTYNKIDTGTSTVTKVTGYINGSLAGQVAGSRMDSVTFDGYYHQSGESVVGQYGHNAKLYFATSDLTTNAGLSPVVIDTATQENFEGYLGDMQLWHRTLTVTQVGALGVSGKAKSFTPSY